MSKSHKSFLNLAYTRLYEHYGPQRWWPAQTPFEVIVGAILTQNTNWTNVEKAIENLKQHRVLAPKGLRDIPSSRLARIIRPAGYFNIKAKRLKNFVTFFFKEYRGSLQKMKQEDLSELRTRLLSVNGIGPETADSILLYALGKPIFVVDAYTKRFLLAHKIIDASATYHQIQDLFMRCIEPDIKIFNEYHALLVRLGKEFSRKGFRGKDDPLRSIERN